MIGRTLSHYRITSALGAGGMGEVYRATDTKLGRDVAIKVLPAEVARDPERLARFRREAQLLASLNHPNIAAIHGLEEVDGTPFLALELVEGEDLSERLKRGAIPLEEALGVARQIAEALEAAHEKGIVHRDLKPANVKLTPEEQVKVLDFGLAKAWAGDPGKGTSSVDASQSPTLAHTGTAAGIILGTAAYMSPEQAMGKAVDKRADIWAFGVVLFEMLTGDRVFNGENASEILASVIKEEPAWERLPAATPTSVTRLLRRCLRKKPRERLHDIGDARLEIEDAGREPGEPTPVGREPRSSSRERLAWGLAAVMSLVAGGLGLRSFIQGDTAQGPRHLSVPLAPAEVVEESFAISPDGSQIVFRGRAPGGGERLYVRALDEPVARELPGTDYPQAPFLSPDGQWAAFFSGEPTLRLAKVPVSGGPVVTLAEGNFRSARGAWTDDGWIVFSQGVGERPGQLFRVRADGGTPEPLKVSDDTANDFVQSISVVPDSSLVLLTVSARGEASTGDETAVVQSLETGERRVLAPGGALPRHLASGHVIYRHSGRLLAGRLDAAGMELVGNPVPLQDVLGVQDVDVFDISPRGVLAFVASRDDSGEPARLAWTDRDGRVTPLFEAFGFDPRLSPDGTRVALDERGRGDVWVWDLDRGTRTRISSAVGPDETGTWSPDGRWIAWSAQHPGETPALYRRRSDGSGPAERLWSDERHHHVSSWSPAGIVVTVDDEETGWDVLVLDPDDPSDPRPLLNATFNESSPRVSPDGGLLVFVSDETGRNEIYVQAFPEPRARVQVSVNGGEQPVWRPGTREIVYRGSGQIMSVTLGPGSPPTVSAPQALFEDRLPYLGAADHTAYDVDREGRFLTLHEPAEAPRRHIRVVFDWMEAAGLRP